MKISINWLKDFVTIPEGIDPKKLGELFTMKTAEVEDVRVQGEGLSGVVVGEILEIKKHPDADKLNLAKVDIGKKEPLNLIFGDMVKMFEGDKVPVAVAPTTLPTGTVIEKRKIRGQTSEGMLCLDQEMGLSSEGVSIRYFPNVKPGTPIVKAMNLDDVILDIDNKSLTHRPDLWGHYGIAREFAGLLKKPFKKLDPATKSAIKEPAKKLNITIKDKEVSPRFSACIVSNVKIKESPEWVQKRLLAVGVRPINNIVDITNYVMVELGQPMHAYDRKVVGTDTLEARFAEKLDTIETIDHKERKLTENDPVVTNGKKIMGLAGIMGSATSEIGDATTEIIFEAANWNPHVIRKSSTYHGLRSEASQRFEKGLDPLLTDLAIKKALQILLETCPNAKLETAITTVGDWKPKTHKIKVDPETANRKIGLQIDEKEMSDILERLDFKVTKKGGILEVEVPTHRGTGDIKTEDDLIEEIARFYGYDEIAPTLPELPIKLPRENHERVIKHKLRNILSLGLGFSEISNYSFYSREDFSKCNLPEKDHFELENYLSADQTNLRISLVPNILKAIQRNLRFYDHFKIYEIGRTYKNIGAYFPKEEKNIVGAIVYKNHKGEAFYDAKGAVETLLERYGVSTEISKGHTWKSYAHPAKYAEYITQNGVSFAQVFELHPGVAKNFELDETKIAIFEINFTELVKMGQTKKKYKKIPKFPGIEIDISVLVDREKEVTEIEKIIKESDPSLITNVALFDIYEGENIEKDKKALAFRITLQALDRTLTDDEMTKVQNAIFENLQGRGGKIRGLN